MEYVITRDGDIVCFLSAPDDRTAELQARTLVYKVYELAMLGGGSYCLESFGRTPQLSILIATDNIPIIDLGDDVYLRWEPSLQE